MRPIKIAAPVLRSSVTETKPAKLTPFTADTLGTQLKRINAHVAQSTKFGTDKRIYVDSLYNRSYRLEMHAGDLGRVASVRSSESAVSPFHKVVIDQRGNAQVHFNSGYTGLIPTPGDPHGALNIFDQLSPGIAIPKRRVLLAVPTSDGKLLDVFSRDRAGKVHLTSYAVAKDTLKQITPERADSVRLANTFTPFRGAYVGGYSPSVYQAQTSRTPSPPVRFSVAPPAPQARSAPVARPLTAPLSSNPSPTRSEVDRLISSSGWVRVSANVRANDGSFKNWKFDDANLAARAIDFLKSRNQFGKVEQSTPANPGTTHWANPSTQVLTSAV